MLNLGLYQSWDDSHEQTAYPFADGATMLAADGASRFPIGVLADAVIGARDVAAPVYVREVKVTAIDAVLTFAQGSTDVATATLDVLSSGWVQLVPSINVVYAGKIKINANSVGAIINLGTGTHVFTADATPLVPYAVFLSPLAGVRGIVLPDGTTLTGDITISLGAGLSGELLPSGQVRIDAIGLPYVGRDDVTAIRRAIRRVEFTAVNVTGETSTVTVTPLRGTIGVDVDNPTATRSPALALTAQGNTLTVEVSS